MDLVSLATCRVLLATALSGIAIIGCGRIGIDRRDEHGMTALMRAAASGNAQLAEDLLTRGADVNAKVPRRDLRELLAFVSWMQELPKSDVGYTPLHYAVQGRSPEVVRILLRHGARLDEPDAFAITPLSLAVLNRDAETVALLVDAGAKPAAHDVALAIRASASTIVEYLLAHGADPNARDRAPRAAAPASPPLIVSAATMGDTGIVRALIDAGADVNAHDRNGWTALRWAQQRNDADHVAVAALLVARGAQDEAGAKADALLNAVRARDVAALREALQGGAAANASDQEGTPVLVSAAQAGLADGVAALIAAGANVEASSPHGPTPLVAAIQAGSIETVKALLGAGARVNRPDGNHLTPLRAASQRDNAEITKLLLASSASPNADALAAAALAGNVEQVAVLLEQGADPNAGGKGYVLSEATRGCTRHDNTLVVRALLDAGADPRRHGDDNYTPLHRAAGLCPATLVKLLIAHGADVNARAINGYTPLIGPAFSGDVETLRMLIAAGADVNARDDAGKSILEYAARHPDIQMELRRAGAR